MSGRAPAAGQQFPRGILFAVGGMLALVIGVAALSRMDGTRSDVPVSTPVAERAFRFEDRADGAIAVLDAADGHLITVVTGQAGFLRATLRGLAQQRLREGIDDQPPFRLTQWADSRLTLDDTATHRHIELEAFGETNEAVFAELLHAPDRAPDRAP